MCCGSRSHKFNCDIHEPTMDVEWCSHIRSHTPTRTRVKELREEIRELTSENQMLRQALDWKGVPYFKHKTAPTPPPLQKAERLDLE